MLKHGNLNWKLRAEGGSGPFLRLFLSAGWHSVYSGHRPRRRRRKGGIMLLSLFLTFFRIGAFTFGGGYAMIALIENICVRKETVDHP